MYETIMNKHAINQVAYIVEDLEKACLEHSETFGSGPFLYMDPMPQKGLYRGKECEWTMQTAYGQFGDKQIEMIKFIEGDANPYGDIKGFHHFSMWVDDYEAAIKHFADLGFEPLMSMQSGGGLKVAYIDCYDKWGHYVEVHNPIEGMWNMVAQAAKEWDGKNPYRKFGA